MQPVVEVVAVALMIPWGFQLCWLAMRGHETVEHKDLKGTKHLNKMPCTRP